MKRVERRSCHTHVGVRSATTRSENENCPGSDWETVGNRCFGFPLGGRVRNQFGEHQNFGCHLHLRQFLVISTVLENLGVNASRQAGQTGSSELTCLLVAAMAPPEETGRSGVCGWRKEPASLSSVSHSRIDEPRSSFALIFQQLIRACFCRSRSKECATQISKILAKF